MVTGYSSHRHYESTSTRSVPTHRAWQHGHCGRRHKTRASADLTWAAQASENKREPTTNLFGGRLAKLYPCPE